MMLPEGQTIPDWWVKHREEEAIEAKAEKAALWKLWKEEQLAERSRV
jgi:hypothetical protein